MRHRASFIVPVVALALSVPSTARAQDVVEALRAGGQFTILTRALTEAGLVETLKGPGPFTMLAPSDAAFNKLPKASLDALFKDKVALRNVLLYHVIAGRLMAADFANLNGKGRKTVEGSETKVSVTGTTVMIGTATVTTSDIAAKNGVIHIIDTVLMPPGR